MANNANIIIKFGFQNIKPHVLFTNNKGQMLYESNHVFDVQELKLIDGLSIITGFVVRQTSVSLEPYKVQLELDGSRNVINASCQCPAGAGSSCKHIAALIIFINNEEGNSKTNEPQLWGKPSKFGQNLYKKGKKISDLFPQKHQNLEVSAVSFKDLIQHHNILSISCSLTSNLYEEERTEVDKICTNILEDLINTIEVHFKNEENFKQLTILIMKQSQVQILNNFIFPLNFIEHNFFFNKIYVDDNAIMLIFNETLEQSQNILWSEHRKLRISASSKAHKIKTLKASSDENKNKLALSLIHETPIKGKGACNVLYGLQTENKAYDYFCSTYNVEVIKCGLIIHSSKPWICASPDGLILKNGEIVSVLEIKCPSSCKKKPFIDPNTGTPNISYLKIQNKVIILNPTHVYYTQIQILMYCTGLSDCNLLIFNMIQPLLLVIKRDSSFLSNLIPKLDDFYFKYYLPNLCNSK